MAIDFSQYDLSQAREIASKFGKATVDEMGRRLHDLDLVDRSVLLNSLKFQVKETGGEVDRIQFSYEFYGKIWEHGANNVFGKGVHLEARPWRDPVLQELVPDVSEEFSAFYALLIIDELKLDSAKMKM